MNNTVVVEAKHEEKTSDGRSYATQSFNQSFSLPAGVDPETVKSSLSKQGNAKNCIYLLTTELEKKTNFFSQSMHFVAICSFSPILTGIKIFLQYLM